MAIKVLIVDDREINVKLLRASLRTEGMETFEAGNGREALDVLARESVDCVVTDILMPEMDGYRLCQEIRASERFGSVPIIVYTATYLSPGDEKLALDAGGDMYLRKPAPAETMYAAIRDLTKQTGKKKTPSKPDVVLKQYSEALIKKLEEKNLQLQNEEEKFRQIAESIQEVFWMTNKDFSEMIYISPAYENIWGRTCESLYTSPQDWADAVHPEDREGTLQAAREGMKTGRSYEMEYRISRPDNEMRWIKVRAFPIKDASGQVYRLTGTASDITEQKRLAAQFQQAQKMEAIGRLAGGVAHDFNNLLTVILGLSEINLEILPPEHALRADFEEIKNTSERAAQLTQQLLAFSRRQVFEPKTVDLSDLVKSAERLLRRVIGEDVKLTSKLAPTLRPVRVDPNQVGQVLVNLCVNARDAMPAGGRITIETADVSLEQNLILERFTIPLGTYVTLLVSDTGEGMTDEVKAHLFEPFFTTKPQGKGTGLGLATCYGIVKQSGGFIQADSELGKGTLFKIYLPIAAKGSSIEATPVGQAGPTPRGQETVLVVEDEAPVRALICRILRARGYSILEGSNGEEGLKMAESDKQKSIRLILTDVVMPLMNGKRLSEALGKVRPDIKVLFASGYPDEVLSQQDVLKPGVSFLRKPFTPEALTRKVRETLDSN